MIEKLYIFEENGILLLKKDYFQTPFQEIESEDLVSGFFSVMFQYFSRNFGRINIIKTDDKVICINHVSGAYVAIVSTRYDPHSANHIKKNGYFAKYEEVWNTNYRLEEISCRILASVSKNIEKRTSKDKQGHIKQYLNMKNFQLLNPKIDTFIKQGNCQIKKIQEMTDKKMSLIDQI